MEMDALMLFKYASPYDVALPQPWADKVKELTGMYPPGHIVWSYAESTIFGEPFPVSNYGANILRLYEMSSKGW